MLTFEKAGEQFHAKPIGEPESCDTAATCLTALRLGHVFSSALVLAHVHARVHLAAVDRIIFGLFSGEWAGGVRGELDEFLMPF